MPMFGELTSGPGAGEVTVMIKTAVSGVISEDPSQLFWFIVTPITGDALGGNTSYLIPNYQSGAFATIIVRGLEPGERYRFNATAANMFGLSKPAISNTITAAAQRMTAYMHYAECVMIMTLCIHDTGPLARFIIVGASSATGGLILISILIMVPVVLIIKIKIAKKRKGLQTFCMTWYFN